MKKILCFCLGFVCCCSVLFTSFEFFLRAIPNDFNKKQYHLSKNSKSIEVLILGSSHTFVGINPEFLSKPAFNLAYSSQTLDLDEKLFNHYKTQLPNLETVVIPVSYFSYVLALEEGNSAYKIKNYNIYYQLYSQTLKVNNQFEVFFQSFDENIASIKDFVENPQAKITVDTLGYINKRFQKKDLNWEESATHAIKNHSKNITDEVVKIRMKENQNSLENIISWCSKNKIKVVLISTPTTDLYVEKFDISQHNHWRKTTQLISEKYPNVIWLNYLEDNNDFELIDFLNADHLSVKGAEKLSKMINNSI